MRAQRRAAAAAGGARPGGATGPGRSGVPWWREAVFYQICPRSFADSNGDGIGDLPGITDRLDYLHGLGVDGLWLTPFYPSPLADFGYDVADYCAVDPAYGGLGDFDRLLAAAHRLGLRVLVDLVPNHTSAQHEWFRASRSERGNRMRDWYVWADPAADGGPPNNWLSCFPAVGPAWTFDPPSGQYFLHSYTPAQPDLNWWHPPVAEAIDGVLRFWLDRGVDGFRVDVPHRMVKDAGLADNPPHIAQLRRAYGRPAPPFRNMNRPEVHQVLRRFRGVLDGYGDPVMVGEVGLTDPVALAGYYGAGDELQLMFNFAFWQQPWSAEAFAAVVADVEATLPAHGWPVYALSNHDLPRAASRYGPAAMPVAAVLLLTLRGTPFLYYGEELGMTDAPPQLDRPADIDGRDGARTPMQWLAGPQAGFTTGRPWLPPPPGAGQVSVAAQQRDPTSLLALYRRLLALRRASPALRHGSYRIAHADGQLLAYLRQTPEQRLLVALNFTAHPARYPGKHAPGRCLLDTHTTNTSDRPVDFPLILQPHQGMIVRLG